MFLLYILAVILAETAVGIGIGLLIVRQIDRAVYRR